MEPTIWRTKQVLKSNLKQTEQQKLLKIKHNQNRASHCYKKSQTYNNTLTDLRWKKIEAFNSRHLEKIRTVFEHWFPPPVVLTVKE